MKIALDTNILLRIILNDDPQQRALAQNEIAQATEIAISTTSLCECVWTLLRLYNAKRADVSAAIRRLIAPPHVRVNQSEVNAGLTMLDAGGDFADGVIAHQGYQLGGDDFLSFDRSAVALLTAQGLRARTP